MGTLIRRGVVIQALVLLLLPAAARAYLDRIGELVGRPVRTASVGPDRQQTISIT